jgi:hypothetical protein
MNVNSLAMAASLSNANVGEQFVKQDRQTKSVIAQQLARLQENRSKNHDQITDEIY